MTNKTTPFNPNDHLIDIHGRAYLPVAARILWFRQDHPLGRIETKIIDWDKEKHTCLFQATVTDAEGRILGVGHNSEAAQFLAGPMQSQYVMMCETGAVGRALGLAGYSTLGAPDFDEGERIVDSPATLMRKGMSK